MANPRTQTWFPIATKFPATLVKDPENELGIGLRDGETPSAYGMGIDRIGSLYAASVPVGTARSTSTAETAPATNATENVITGFTWHYAHRRLWGYKSTASYILYGGDGYKTLLIPWGKGMIDCTDGGDTANIVVGLPAQQDNREFYVALKAASAYVVSNSQARLPQKHQVTQSIGVSNASYVTELDGIIYCAMASGVYSLNPSTGEVTELTLPIRNNIGNFKSVALLADYKKKRIIGTSKFCIQLPQGDVPFGLYDYSTSGFLWTSPTLIDEEAQPIHFTKLSFVIEHTGSTKGTFTFQVSQDFTWTPEQSVSVPYEHGNYSLHVVPINGCLATRRWAMRITAMSGLRIRRILGFGSTAGMEGFST